MEINQLSDDQENILYLAADEYETNGVIYQICPLCGGKLYFKGTSVSYQISCEKCGILQSIRGI